MPRSARPSVLAMLFAEPSGSSVSGTRELRSSCVRMTSDGSVAARDRDQVGRCIQVPVSQPEAPAEWATTMWPACWISALHTDPTYLATGSRGLSPANPSWRQGRFVRGIGVLSSAGSAGDEPAVAFHVLLGDGLEPTTPTTLFDRMAQDPRSAVHGRWRSSAPARPGCRRAPAAFNSAPLRTHIPHGPRPDRSASFLLCERRDDDRQRRRRDQRRRCTFAQPAPRSGLPSSARGRTRTTGRRRLRHRS